MNLTYYIRLPLVEVGGLAVKNLETLAIDLSKVSDRFGKPLHGVLGLFLKDFVVTIDYRSKRITLERP